MTTKELKQTISQALGVKTRDISVRLGGDSLSHYILVQSSTVNLWDASEVMSSLFPSYKASSCVFATINRSSL